MAGPGGGNKWIIKGCLLLENRLQKSFIGKERSAYNRYMSFFQIKQFQAKQCLALEKKEVGSPGDVYLFSLCLRADICSFCLIFFFSDFDLRNHLKKGGRAMQG